MTHSALSNIVEIVTRVGISPLEIPANVYTDVPATDANAVHGIWENWPMECHVKFMGR